MSLREEKPTVCVYCGEGTDDGHDEHRACLEGALRLLDEWGVGRRPRLLDLFCGAGGCAVGYQRAGFEVVGVDITPQPNYPFKFWQHDALAFLDLDAPQDIASNFDAIHASPPCQGYTAMNHRWGSESPRLIAEVRKRLQKIDLPYVIENVPGARSHMDHPIQLCGSSFGLKVHRHRLFECSFPAMSLACAHNGAGVAVYGKLDGRRLWTRKDGSELRAVATLEEAQEAMGIDWMEWDELREAIPPAMTEHIGGYLMSAVRQRKEFDAQWDARYAQ